MEKQVKKAKWYRTRGASIFGMAIIGLAWVVAFCFCIPALTKIKIIDLMATHPWSLITGLAAAPALLLTWYWRDQAKCTELQQRDKDLEQRDKDLEIAQEVQLTERFATAVKLLGDESMEIRLGGIYALERLAKNSLADHWSVMETLSAFIRENAPRPLRENNAKEQKTEPETENEDSEEKAIKPRTDIQAALTVIGRRSEEQREFEKASLYTIDLSNSDLRGAKLIGAHLEDVDFWKSHMRRAYLVGTHLEQANLEQTNLEKAFLVETHLEGANVMLANMTGAQLWGAFLEGTALNLSTLKNAGYNRNKWELMSIEYDPTVFPEGFKPEEHGMVDMSKTENRPSVE